jgi:hypothetical protein
MSINAERLLPGGADENCSTGDSRKNKNKF